MAMDPAKKAAAVAKMRQTMLIRYGSDYWSKLGKRGGYVNVQRYGADHMRRIGSRGGETTLTQHGRQHFREIGHVGGNVSAKKRASRKRGAA